MVTVDFHRIIFPTMEVKGSINCLVFNNFSECLILCSNRRKKLIQVWNKLRVSKWWQNDDRIWFFGWTGQNL